VVKSGKRYKKEIQQPRPDRGKTMQNHRKIQSIPDNKAYQDIQSQNGDTRPYKVKTVESGQPQGKAAKSDHTKPDISGKTAELIEHKRQNGQTQSKQNSKSSTHKVKRP